MARLDQHGTLGHRPRREEGRRGRRLAAGRMAAVCVGLSLCLLPVDMGRAEEPVDIAGFKQKADEWLALRREIARSQAEWQKERELLKSEVDLLGEQKDHLAARLDEQESELRKLEEKLRETGGELPTDGDEAERLKTAVAESEAYLRQWRARLPLFLSEALDKTFAQIEPGIADEAGLGERLQRVVNLHAQLQQLTRSVNVGSILLTGPNGKSRQMEAVLLGTAVGYAVALDGSLAAVGFPGADGWQWDWRPELAYSIRNMLACYRKEQPAAFVHLPVRVEGRSP
jgi:hypothetical protein